MDNFITKCNDIKINVFSIMIARLILNSFKIDLLFNYFKYILLL
jgi:hypothetical protein